MGNYIGSIIQKNQDSEASELQVTLRGDHFVANDSVQENGKTV